MFPAAIYTPEWFDRQRQELGGCDPAILEKCVRALTLLGHLQESGLPFLFKGGTSLLLHLPQVRRLSRDIDIVCGCPPGELDAVLTSLARREPFLRHEEDNRGCRGLPRRRHFKFFYRSVLRGHFETEVLLDAVEEAHEVHEVVRRPIRTAFLQPEREILVRVPSIESLIGDKLTAFAPHTTGVPFYSEKSGAEQLQQVTKQLFDVGVLFEAATDFGKIAATYNAVQAQESSYRSAQPARDASLDDTLSSCLAITATKRKVLDAYPDAPLLHEGMDRMRGHLTWAEFIRDREPRRTLAARAAVLAAHLRAGRLFDFGTVRYTGSTSQLATLRRASLNNRRHSWLDGLKAVNPEAYHYWLLALEVCEPP